MYFFQNRREHFEEGITPLSSWTLSSPSLWSGSDTKRLIMFSIQRVLFFVAAYFLIPTSNALGQVAVGTAPYCDIEVFIYPNFGGGLSTYYLGSPVILIDQSIYDGNYAFKEFTLAHECGHFVLNHMTPQGLLNRWWASGQQELAADCWAAKNVNEDISREVAQIFRQTQGSKSPAPGYPTGNQRASNIEHCIDGY